MNDRRFYVSGFPNRKGKFRITGIVQDGEAFDISMGQNGVTYNPTRTVNRLTFRDNQGKPMSAGQVFNAMNESTELTKILENAGLKEESESRKDIDLATYKKMLSSADWHYDNMMPKDKRDAVRKRIKDMRNIARQSDEHEKEFAKYARSNDW